MLPPSAEDVTPAVATASGDAVAACLNAIVSRMAAADLALEAVTTSLEKRPAAADARASHLACLLLAARAVAEHCTAPSPALDRFPHLLLQEVVHAMARGRVREQALGNRVLLTLLPLFRQPLKARGPAVLADRRPVVAKRAMRGASAGVARGAGAGRAGGAAAARDGALAAAACDGRQRRHGAHALRRARHAAAHRAATT